MIEISQGHQDIFRPMFSMKVSILLQIWSKCRSAFCLTYKEGIIVVASKVQFVSLVVCNVYAHVLWHHTLGEWTDFLLQHVAYHDIMQVLFHVYQQINHPLGVYQWTKYCVSGKISGHFLAHLMFLFKFLCMDWLLLHTTSNQKLEPEKDEELVHVFNSQYYKAYCLSWKKRGTKQW